MSEQPMSEVEKEDRQKNEPEPPPPAPPENDKFRDYEIDRYRSVVERVIIRQES